MMLVDVARQGGKRTVGHPDRDRGHARTSRASTTAGHSWRPPKLAQDSISATRKR
jgi:hypothetical protein